MTTKESRPTVQPGEMAPDFSLQRLGVDTLVIVASDLERARLYVKHRPISVPLAADPDYATHRAYGLPTPPMTAAEIEQASKTIRVELKKTAVTANDLVELREAAQAITAAPTTTTADAEQLTL